MRIARTLGAMHVAVGFYLHLYVHVFLSFLFFFFFFFHFSIFFFIKRQQTLNEQIETAKKQLFDELTASHAATVEVKCF